MSPVKEGVRNEESNGIVSFFNVFEGGFEVRLEVFSGKCERMEERHRRELIGTFNTRWNNTVVVKRRERKRDNGDGVRGKRRKGGRDEGFVSWGGEDGEGGVRTVVVYEFG